MKVRVAINGFGRIGRSAFKVAFDRADIDVVAINDLTDTKTLAHLLKYDSNYGMYDHKVESDENHINVDEQKITVLSEPEPAKLPWKEMEVDVVIESTGLFVKPELAKDHIKAGAKKVVISAPSKGDHATAADTIVLGVNDDKIEKSSDVLSNGSCTTNCIVPAADVMDSNFGVEKAMMTTIHSYTADQRLQDAPHKDMRRARAAAQNIVPTTSGAAIATSRVLPQFKGIFDGMAMRVPTSVVSLSDFTFLLKKKVTVEEVNEAFKKAAKEPYYQGILDVCEEPLVSSDFIGNSHSSIVDLGLTKVVDGDLVKIVAWYDNEWGYSNRLVELVADAGKALQKD